MNETPATHRTLRMRAYALGVNALTRERRALLSSEAYATLARTVNGRRSSAVNDALTAASRFLLDGQRIAGYELGLGENGTARPLERQEQRRLNHLRGLHVKDAHESAELAEYERTLTLLPVVENGNFFKKATATLRRLLTTPLFASANENCRQEAPIKTNVESPTFNSLNPVALERLAAMTVTKAWESQSEPTYESSINVAGQLLHLDAAEVESGLKGYVANFTQHRHAGARPLPFYHGSLLPAGSSLERVAGDYVASIGDARIAATFLNDEIYHAYGLTVTKRDVELAVEQNAPRRRTLERIVTAAVNQYNERVDAYRNGDTKSLYNLYEKGAAALRIDVDVYHEALREHVRQSVKRYETIDEKIAAAAVVRAAEPGVQDPEPNVPNPVLQRFDRTLLSDHESYAREVVEAYRGGGAHGRKTLKGIAAELSAKYGMRVSASTVSRIAREYLNKESNGASYVSNREDAKRQYAARTPRSGNRPASQSSVLNRI